MARGRPAKKTEEMDETSSPEGSYIENVSNVIADDTVKTETIIPITSVNKTWTFKIKKYYDVMGLDRVSKEVYGLPDGKVPSNEDVAGMDMQTRDDLMHALIDTFIPKNIRKDQSQYRNIVTFRNSTGEYSFLSPVDVDCIDKCWSPLKGHIQPETFIRAVYDHIDMTMPLFLINMKKYEL